MSHCPSTTSLVSPELERVAELLDSLRPQVVIVVGTGISINATGEPHASWLGLLKHGIRHLVQRQFQPQWGIELEASLNAAFSPKFDLQAALQHADLVEQALNTPDKTAFARWLEATFANFKSRNDVQSKGPLEALRDLYQAGALLLTTNYDSLLSDITGAPPVTWEEHADFHKVMTRQKSGILHIHGHWQRPSSIVLGRASYNRVVDDEDLQQLFKTLWLEWSWIYVGCGDGLDDPNLGRLLEWGKRWGCSALPDFFFAREDRAREIASRLSKPANLFTVGYPSYNDLANVLRSITPATRCWPFEPVDDTFRLFRLPGSNVPFPSRQEYLDGDVPALTADTEVEKRLQTHGWACCIGVASVGKTTLALRVATRNKQRAQPVFYLDLKWDFLDDTDFSPVAAVHRLARAETLLVLDNIHIKAELAHKIWQLWNAKPSRTRGQLLLVGTQTQNIVFSSPEQDLMFFSKHPVNPAILLHPTQQDLSRLAKHLYRRINGSNFPPIPEPPAEALAEWHRIYGAHLNAFTFAVLNSLAEFSKGNWSLPPERASAWVHAHWLSKLDSDPAELENLICLAVFGAQQLEMLVHGEALPHPGKSQKLSKLQILAETQRGRFRQYRMFELREPGWGHLILAALEHPVDADQILFGAALRHLPTAIVLSARLQRANDQRRLKALWRKLGQNANEVANRALELPLQYLSSLFRFAIFSEHDLSNKCWIFLEKRPNRFLVLARATSLDCVASFLESAERQKRDTAPLWDALIGKPGEPDQPAKLVEFVKAARATSLDCVASFLESAEKQKRDTAPLWDALIGKPGELDQPAKLVEFVKAARATSLEKIGFFLEVAQNQKRDTAPLWDALVGKPGESGQSAKLAEFMNAAWATSLEKIGFFFEVAQNQKRDTAPLWDALIDKPGEPGQSAKLAEFVNAAWATSLECVGSFLEVAQNQKRDTAPLWDALIGKPGESGQSAKLAEFVNAAWATSLECVGSFLAVAENQKRETDLLWQALANEPDHLAELARTASTGELTGFFHHAPSALIEIALREIKPGHWNSIPATEAMAGATWLALDCREAKRVDLTADLIDVLLRRANWQDFFPYAGGFAQACWLLASVPPRSGKYVDVFVKRVCSDKWVGVCYSITKLGPVTRSAHLASGLMKLALTQPAKICWNFHHSGLGWRIFQDLARFESAAPNERAEIIQFLGCAMLCGWHTSKRQLLNIKSKFLSELPVSVLLHRPEVHKVEDYQFQLWIGLRAFVSVTNQKIYLPQNIIAHTLCLWRTNLAETVPIPQSVINRLNLSMIAWLESCLRANPAALIPSKEPLYVLAGFPCA